MSASAVSAYSYTHSVTYVADNILRSLKEIIRESGLDPSKMVGEWESTQRALNTWIGSEHLSTVRLEIYDPKNNQLIRPWDIDIVYGYGGSATAFWTDTDQLKYELKKLGVVLSSALYDIVLFTKPGRPDVLGWGPGQARSTAGFVRKSLGTTVEHSGLGGNTSVWRRP